MTNPTRHHPTDMPLATARHRVLANSQYMSVWRLAGRSCGLTASLTNRTDIILALPTPSQHKNVGGHSSIPTPRTNVPCVASAAHQTLSVCSQRAPQRAPQPLSNLSATSPGLFRNDNDSSSKSNNSNNKIAATRRNFSPCMRGWMVVVVWCGGRRNRSSSVVVHVILCH